MRLLELVGRGLRLGFFVGLGVASALVEACSSDTVPVDSSTADKGAVRDSAKDSARRDAAKDSGRRDAAPDKAKPGDGGPPKDARWDMPLE